MSRSTRDSSTSISWWRVMADSTHEQLTGSAAIAKAGRTHLARIFGLLNALGGHTSPVDFVEEDHFRVREGFHNFKLEEVEKNTPETDFAKADPSPDVKLDYFARMLQRTQLVGHFVHKGIEIPVHYSITGVIILQRAERKFKVWREPMLLNNVMLPFQFVGKKEVLKNFEEDELLRLVDTSGDRPEYTQMRIAAVRRARELTTELRGQLCSAWGLSDGQDLSKYLVLSGMVADVPNAKLGSNLVALSQRAYVPWQNSELLEPQLGTPAFHRGKVMRTINTAGDDPMQKYTWFLRLRTSSQADPEFGLLRCTCLAENDAEAIERADAISGHMVRERLPVTFPAEGWDKLIFPLKLCTDYLESLVPTKTTVKAYFART